MRRLFLVGALCLLATVPFSVVMSQTMVVYKTDGTQQNIDLTSLRSFMLPESSLMLQYSNSTTSDILLSEVKKIVFDSATGADQSSVADVVSVSPNPAVDRLVVSGLSVLPTEMSIFSVDGILKLKKVLSSQSAAINVSGLSEGVYLLRVGNVVKKFVKQ